MPDVVIQRKTSKGKWIGDATFFGDDAMERAEAALAVKERKAFQHQFRIAPPKRPATDEELVNNRFKEKPASTEGRWVMGDE